jgi:hypothetical protein
MLSNLYWCYACTIYTIHAVYFMYTDCTFPFITRYVTYRNQTQRNRNIRYTAVLHPDITFIACTRYRCTYSQQCVTETHVLYTQHPRYVHIRYFIRLYNTDCSASLFWDVVQLQRTDLGKVYTFNYNIHELYYASFLYNIMLLLDTTRNKNS